MDELFAKLFRAVRESCTPAVWSRGVESARQEAVTGDRESADEIILRVLVPGKGVSPTVSLYPEECDWQCSCGDDDDPCGHVAAAVIALRRAKEQGQALPRGVAATGKLVYRFQKTPEGLAFERYIITDGSETCLTHTLSALTSGRVAGPPLAATAEDMEVEVALTNGRRGVLPAACLPRLLKALARGLEVTLDGTPVRIDAEPVGLVAEVLDDGPGVRLVGRQDAAILELYANGVALCKTGLRPVALPELTHTEKTMLRGDGRFFGPRDLGELVSEVLPALEPRIKVHVTSRKLPNRSRARPRLEMELKVEGEQLQVTPTLVYGNPPVARVWRGQLESLDPAEIPARDQAEEQRLTDELRRLLGLVPDEATTATGEAAVALANRLARSGLDESTWRGAGLASFALRGAVTAELVVTAGDFTLAFPLGSGGDGGRLAADPARVLSAFARGESLVPLTSGGWAEIPAAWLARHGARVLELLEARGAAPSLPRVALPLLAELCEDTGTELPQALAELRRRLATYAGPEAYMPPPGLKATLRTYQQAGASWLATLKSLGFGALLADDMGLGKTLQTIVVMNGRTLVVAPTSVIYNWRAELARFRPELQVALYHGPDRTLDPRADVVVTTYALLRLDNETLAREHWHMIVLDEAQAIKNPASHVARAAGKLTGDFRVALSGTPVENRLADLWSLMHFLNPGLLGDQANFQERYGRAVEAGQEVALARLRTRVKPFILRRLKREVAPELPPRTDVVLSVELSAAERTVYDTVRAAARQDIVHRLAAGQGVLAALEALLRLRQACCHPALLPGQTPTPGVLSSKLTLLIDTLTEATAEGHKTLVFSQWTSHLDLMEPALHAAGIPFLRLDGQSADRAGIVRQFQEDDAAPVLLMSLKAGGVGLNLTAADAVIIADPWWNPAAEDQAADRAHRIGQERPVLVQRLVAHATVEERILALQEKKRAVAAAAVGGGVGPGATLTRDDLLALLD